MWFIVSFIGGPGFESLNLFASQSLSNANDGRVR